MSDDQLARILGLLDEIDTKVEKTNALLRALAQASGNSQVDLQAAADQLGIVTPLDPGHNEVDPELSGTVTVLDPGHNEVDPE